MFLFMPFSYSVVPNIRGMDVDLTNLGLGCTFLSNLMDEGFGMNRVFKDL